MTRWYAVDADTMEPIRGPFFTKEKAIHQGKLAYEPWPEKDYKVIEVEE